MTKKSVTAMIALIFCSFLLSIVYIVHNGSYVPTFVKNKMFRQVVIDPGHGGEDGGAVVGDVFEKDINLKIAKILKELLDVSGIQTIMTRTEDVSIYDEGADSLRKKKCSDLTNRQPNNKRNIKPVKDNVYLIYNAKTPAVLCECGFMSNKDEIALLKDENYQKKMAFSIYAGILKFYSS